MCRRKRRLGLFSGRGRHRRHRPSIHTRRSNTRTFTTYTSLTCNDHGTGQGTDEYSADPYLYLYDDQDTLIAQDDDSAAHNINGMCWDAHIEIVDLAAGTYRLNANVYEEEYGVYSMDISGVSAFDGEDP